MRRWPIAVALLAIGLLAHGQIAEADMQGEWTVYPVLQLSRYTLSEYQAGQTDTIRGSGTIQLNEDGTLTTDVAGIEALGWSIDEGFLMLETGTAKNLFFLPRRLSEDTWFLVEVEVTEINERIIYLRSNPNGSLVFIRS
jgi:hypothetical protein